MCKPHSFTETAAQLHLRKGTFTNQSPSICLDVAEPSAHLDNSTMKLQSLRPSIGTLFKAGASRPSQQIRCLHKTRPPPTIPEPRPFIPDVHTFLTLIGRGLSKHSKKFPSWDGLFSLTGHELKELGIEPPRSRKYLVQWMQKYRKGAFGPGGDFKYVKDGEAILKVATPPASVVSDAEDEVVQ